MELEVFRKPEIFTKLRIFVNITYRMRATSSENAHNLFHREYILPTSCNLWLRKKKVMMSRIFLFSIFWYFFQNFIEVLYEHYRKFVCLLHCFCPAPGNGAQISGAQTARRPIGGAQSTAPKRRCPNGPPLIKKLQTNFNYQSSEIQLLNNDFSLIRFSTLPIIHKNRIKTEGVGGSAYS